MLKYAGLPFTVFEATNRLGGRVWTLDDFVPGTHIEAGAELIGKNHPGWWRFARRFGLHLDPITTEDDYDPCPDKKKREPDKNKPKSRLTVRLILEGRTLVGQEKCDVYKAWERKLEIIEREAAGVNAHEPWKSPDAEKHDRKSITQRLDERDLWGSNWKDLKKTVCTWPGCT